MILQNLMSNNILFCFFFFATVHYKPTHFLIKGTKYQNWLSVKKSFKIKGLGSGYTALQNFTEGHSKKTPKKQRYMNPDWGSDTGGLI